jgi:hypothetical protein
MHIMAAIFLFVTNISKGIADYWRCAIRYSQIKKQDIFAPVDVQEIIQHIVLFDPGLITVLPHFARLYYRTIRSFSPRLQVKRVITRITVKPSRYLLNSIGGIRYSVSLKSSFTRPERSFLTEFKMFSSIKQAPIRHIRHSFLFVGWVKADCSAPSRLRTVHESFPSYGSSLM